mgnify:CR=1 FL=1
MILFIRIFFSFKLTTCSHVDNYLFYSYLFKRYFHWEIIRQSRIIPVEEKILLMNISTQLIAEVQQYVCMHVCNFRYNIQNIQLRIVMHTITIRKHQRANWFIRLNHWNISLISIHVGRQESNRIPNIYFLCFSFVLLWSNKIHKSSQSSMEWRIANRGRGERVQKRSAWDSSGSFLNY